MLLSECQLAEPKVLRIFEHSNAKMIKLTFLKAYKNPFTVALLLATIGVYFMYSYANYDLAPSQDDVLLKTALFLKLPNPSFENLLYPSLMRLTYYFSENNISLLFNFYFIISSIVFITFFYYLRFCKIGFVLSYFLALGFLFSSFQISLSPRITLLNLIFGFIFLSIITLKSESYIRWAYMAVCLLLCNYVSVTEFLYFFLLAFGICCYKILSHKSLSTISKIKPIALILAIFGILAYLGGGTQNQSAFVFEFKYHFLDNWKFWTGEDYDFQDELREFDRIYGKSNSLYEFATVNPQLFFKHIKINLYNYLITVFKIVKSCFYNPFASILGVNTRYIFLLILAFFVVKLDAKASYNKLKAQLNFNKSNLGFVEMFSLPGFVIAIIVYPRNHFTLLDLPIYFLLVAILLQSIVLKSNKIENWIKGAIFLIFIGGIVTQKPSIAPGSNLESYLYIKNASKKKHIEVLSNDIFGYYFFEGNCTLHGFDGNKEDLTESLNTKKYDILYLTALDLEIPRVREFLKNKNAPQGYVKITKFESVRRNVFVKKESLHLF